MKKTQTISPEFSYKSNYLTIHGAKMHYIEKGEGDPILFLQGDPTSSYLWQNTNRIND